MSDQRGERASSSAGQLPHVLILEDLDHHWDRYVDRFEGDYKERLVPPLLARTAVQAIDMICRYSPDVVIIDDWIPWQKDAKGEPNAIRFLLELNVRLGADWPQRPKLVLWTARADERDTFAFSFYGGDLYCDKNVHDPEREALEAALRALAGERDTYPEPVLSVPHANRQKIDHHLILLSALQDGASNNAIAELLRKLGAPPTTSEQSIADRLNDLRGELRSELNSEKLPREVLWQRAREYGFRWIRTTHAILAHDHARRQSQESSVLSTEAMIPAFYFFGADPASSGRRETAFRRYDAPPKGAGGTIG